MKRRLWPLLASAAAWLSRRRRSAGAGRCGGDAVARLSRSGLFALRPPRVPEPAAVGRHPSARGCRSHAGPLFGARLGLEDAYRFARGEEVVSNTGQPVKLARPLDWLVIADHSDAMGFFRRSRRRRAGYPRVRRRQALVRRPSRRADKLRSCGPWT